MIILKAVFTAVFETLYGSTVQYSTIQSPPCIWYTEKLNNVERGSAFQEFECQYDTEDASYMYKWEYYFSIIKWHIRYSH